MKRGGMRVLTRMAAFTALALAVHAVEAAETLKVAYRTEDSDRMMGGGKGAAFALDLVTEVAKRAGYEVKPVPCAVDRNARMLEEVDADLIASSFKFPEMETRWHFIPSRLGSADIALYAKKPVADQLSDIAINQWPRQKLAMAKGALLVNFDYNKWSQETLANVDEVLYPDQRSALEAVRRGECTLCLIANSSEGEGLKVADNGLMKVLRVSSRPCFVAVRRENRKLYQEIEEGLESLLLNERETVEALRKKHFGAAGASAKNRVRVARYFEPGLCEFQETGLTRGANDEYIARIAETAGWEVEWISCRYVKALEALESGRIDVVPGVTITEDRRRRLLFPLIPTGNYTDYLFCRREAPYREGYYKDWAGAIIATGPGDQSNSALRRFIADHSVDCKVQVYATYDEAVNAYYRGECQILYAAGSVGFARERSILRFDTVPAYVCVSPKRPDLADQLQQALERINDSEPDFFAKVEGRNFLARELKGIQFTLEERVYLRKRAVNGDCVRMEIFPEVHPLKWMRNGTAAGYIVHLAELIRRRSGLEFEFLPPVDMETARRRFLDGECDFWLDYAADTAGLPFTRGTIDAVHLKDVLICRRDTRLSDPSAGRLAVPAWQLRTYGLRLGKMFQRNLLVPYPDVEACVNAVKYDEVDATIASVLVAASAVRTIDSDNELDIRTVDMAHQQLPFRVVPSPKADPRLVSIVRKAFDSLSQAEFDTAESSTVVNLAEQEVSKLDVILRWTARALVSVLLVLLFFFVISARRKSKAMSTRERRSLYRDQYLVKAAKGLENTAERIDTLAEYLRNPEASRESMLDWTADIIALTDDLVDRFRKFVKIAEKHADESMKSEEIRGGGGGL